jgi:hypothetical protein
VWFFANRYWQSNSLAPPTSLRFEAFSGDDRKKKRRGLSKLDPREFIGGFDRLEITCPDGDAEKTSTPDLRAIGALFTMRA